MNNNLQTKYRAGFVAVLGRPNVGKSTLVNALLGQKVAAVSPKAQTTRARQLAILTGEDTQIIFIDTPGMHNPINKLGRAMNAIVEQTLQDADIILWLVDASQPPQDEDLLLKMMLEGIKDLPPVVLTLNKIDLVKNEDLDVVDKWFHDLYPAPYSIQISARRNAGLSELLAILKGLLPEGNPFYPDDQVTDYYERQIAADLIREAALIFLQQEVPHAIAVRVDEYTERENGAAFIAATIFVEKDSQKGIVIGKGGSMLKKIGSMARKLIEEMSGRSIYLELRVKVSENWRNNNVFLQRMGYQDVEE
ncbi:MAG TPA: GTPase Era [Anaerolineaceae bacterium]|uniref:GTPase Era n=1 Tax=Anaerolinea thermophila TaxID=167964 RepID=A0A101FXW9_9CHLR|nr:MAG: GTPase Era [Anaerolinea thermophila]HAF61124.1 GTPase Era [Anaerolineaceae bacterium]